MTAVVTTAELKLAALPVTEAAVKINKFYGGFSVNYFVMVEILCFLPTFPVESLLKMRKTH